MKPYNCTLKNNLLLLIALLGLALANVQNSKTSMPKISISKQTAALNFSPMATRFYHLGMQRLLAASLWITTLIESDYEHYKGEDANSWMSLRFQSISRLSPYFYENYYYGGMYLAVMKDDVIGAKELFDQGLKYYPQDFWLLYHGAYNYYFELGKSKEALELYERALLRPEAKKIPHLASLVAKIKREEGGSYEDIYQLLYSSWQSAPENTPIKKKYHELLYALKAEYDLNCLNGLDARLCSTKDFDGRYYLKSGGIYRASKNWVRIKIQRKAKKLSD